MKAKDATYGTAQTGAIVFVDAAVTTASTKTANVTASGFYYFDGSIWQIMGSSSSASIYTGTDPITVNNTTKTIGVCNATIATNGTIRLAGDLNYNSSTAPRVTGIQNVPVSTTAPTNSYVLTYNSSTGKWEPAPVILPATVPEFETLTSTSGGPYSKTAFLSCQSQQLGNGVTLLVNGTLVAQTQGYSNYKVTASVVVPKGASWTAQVTGGISCVLMKW